MEQHAEAVASISRQIKSFFHRKEGFKIYHGSTNSTRQLTFDRKRMIDTSKLNSVLQVDVQAKTILVEPNVPMDQLVDATLPHGLVPPVVMEFPGITVGGGFAGTAGESSSFKYSFFDKTVNWIEMVLPNGDVVKASPHEHADLFYGAAGTFGTLGVATLFEIALVDAKKFVEVTYHRASSVEEALRRTEQETKKPDNDYLDGIIFAKDHAAVITGQLTDTPGAGSKVQGFMGSWDPWFYLHAQNMTKDATKKVTDAVPLKDYLFRYDRGAFWTGMYGYHYFLAPFNRVTRWLMDYFMHTRVLYHGLHASGHANFILVQDLAIPPENAQKFIEWVDKELGFYPLWLCPLKMSEKMALNPRLNAGSDGMLMNVGVWGPGRATRTEMIELNRSLEAEVRKLGGIKWLYARVYYTEEEFWRTYDRKWYDELRTKYQATYLPSVFDKVKTDIAPRPEEERSWVGSLKWHIWMWPVSGLYGVAATIFGRDYLLGR